LHEVIFSHTSLVTQADEEIEKSPAGREGEANNEEEKSELLSQADLEGLSDLELAQMLQDGDITKQLTDQVAKELEIRLRIRAYDAAKTPIKVAPEDKDLKERFVRPNLIEMLPKEAQRVLISEVTARNKRKRTEFLSKKELETANRADEALMGAYVNETMVPMVMLNPDYITTTQINNVERKAMTRNYAGTGLQWSLEEAQKTATFHAALTRESMLHLLAQEVVIIQENETFKNLMSLAAQDSRDAGEAARTLIPKVAATAAGGKDGAGIVRKVNELMQKKEETRRSGHADLIGLAGFGSVKELDKAYEKQKPKQSKNTAAAVGGGATSSNQSSLRDTGDFISEYWNDNGEWSGSWKRIWNKEGTRTQIASDAVISATREALTRHNEFRAASGLKGSPAKGFVTKKRNPVKKPEFKKDISKKKPNKWRNDEKIS